MELSDSDRLKIIDWAKRHPKIWRVFLYGSRARGNCRIDSDIDLAIEMCFQDWFDWHTQFENNPDLHLSHEVDLEWYSKSADLERVGLGVERDGILLYEREMDAK